VGSARNAPYCLPTCASGEGAIHLRGFESDGTSRERHAQSAAIASRAVRSMDPDELLIGVPCIAAAQTLMQLSDGKRLEQYSQLLPPREFADLRVVVHACHQDEFSLRSGP
jgi:hypothetical protein